MQLIFLGTSAMVPTKDRNQPAVYLRYKDQGILMDCGEGTQRQLKTIGIKPSKISRILLSHWHGDHVLGLPGLLQTLSTSSYENVLRIYGPVGSKSNIANLLRAFDFNIEFELEIIEIQKGRIIDHADFFIDTIKLEHRSPCFGFAFQEKDRRRIKLAAIKKLCIPEGPLLGELQLGRNIKWKGKTIRYDETTYIVPGKKIAYVTDTRVCNGAKKLAKDADILIAEAVYTSTLKEQAEEYGHMTARQAAQLASQNNVKKLIITHFSQRYKTAEPLLEDAKTVFENTIAAYDFMKVKI